MFAIGMGATLASGFMAAAGDIFKGQATQKMQQYQAGLALQRANIAGLNANLAIADAGTQSMETGLRGGQVVGHMRAGAGAGNIDANTGSAARAQASQTWATQTTENIQQTQGARKAYGFQVAQATDVAQAGADIAAGQTARTEGEIGAVTTALGTAASVSSKWQQASLYGAVPGLHADDSGLYFGA